MSICEGIDQIVDKHLGVTAGKAPHYKHKTSCNKMNNKPEGFDAYEMLSEMLEQIERNRAASPNGKADNKEPSKENWRFEKQKPKSENNKSAEKNLEKDIARFMDDTWVNQVPVASGLFDSDKDKKRSIDLVHQVGDGEYEFIELKVASNTPLMAAIECLIYGVFYIYARLHRDLFSKKATKLLTASSIHLQVLAPKEYYQEYEKKKVTLNWLPAALNDGLSKLLANNPLQGTLEMDFSFHTIPEEWAAKALRDALAKRQNIWDTAK